MSPKPPTRLIATVVDLQEFRETLRSRNEIAPDQLNDEEWYNVIEELLIDRMSLLTILGALDLVLKHQDLPLTTRENCTTIGRGILNKLITEGMKAPLDVFKAYYQTFLI